jgi:hypothetical protein
MLEERGNRSREGGRAQCGSPDTKLLWCPDTRATLPAPRRNVRSTPDGGLHGSLGSTGLSSMPPHYSRELEHGPGAGSGHLPRFPPPTCSRPVSGVRLELFSYCFSLCDLRLFVNKKMLDAWVRGTPSRQIRRQIISEGGAVRRAFQRDFSLLSEPTSDNHTPPALT